MADAARDYRVGLKLVKDASELLLSGMDDLVAAVESEYDRKDFWIPAFAGMAVWVVGYPWRR